LEIRSHHGARNAALGFALLVAASMSAADLSFISAAIAQQDTSTRKPADALAAYGAAVSRFETVLRQRRAQIDSRQ